MQTKIKQLSEISDLVAKEKKLGHKVVHCHGVFDLLHPGHITHFQEAKKQGDKLVVSLTPDQFVNKGPGRPAFSEQLRLEQIASLACVDYVVLNDHPDATSLIEHIAPDIYVKGKEYANHTEDVTGKISEEASAIAKVGGKIAYTEGIVFSSSNLINQYFDTNAKRLAPFVKRLKDQFSLKQIVEYVESFSDLNILVVGDAILDEYQYVEMLGQSGKGQQLTARLLDQELFLGGSLIIANHLASFVKNVTLLTAVGKNCPHLDFIRQNLATNVTSQFICLEDHRTLTKKRYVSKDGDNIQKFFETYSSNQRLLSQKQTEEAIALIHKEGKQADCILSADFGNGFTNSQLIHALGEAETFLAVNTQTNSGNRGFNVITHYPRADFISLNEPELRLAAHDRNSALAMVMHDMTEVLRCPRISVTRGTRGVYLIDKSQEVEVPALTERAIDRVGAGDSYFALATLATVKKLDPLIAGLLGSIAAAIDVQIVGNKEAVEKKAFLKYLTRLLK